METQNWWKIAFDDTAWIETDFPARGDNRIEDIPHVVVVATKP